MFFVGWSWVFFVSSQYILITALLLPWREQHALGRGNCGYHQYIKHIAAKSYSTSPH